MKINWIEIENVKSFKAKTRVNLNPEHNFVVGTNGSGKTTILQVLASCMLTLIPNYTINSTQRGDDHVKKYETYKSENIVELPKNYERKSDLQTIKMEISFEGSWQALISEVGRYINVFEEHREYIDVSFWSGANSIDATRRAYEALRVREGVIFSFSFDIIQKNERTQTLELTQESKTNNEQVLLLLENIEVLRIIYNQLYRAGLTTELIPKSLQVIYFGADRVLGFPRTINLNRGSSEEYNQNNAYTQKASVMHNLFNHSSFDYAGQTLRRLAEGVIYQIWVNKSAKPLEEVDEYTRLRKYVKDLLGLEFKIIIPGSPYEEMTTYFTREGHEVFFSQMSSGERSLLHFIFALNNPDIANSFILIDEAEIHLHGNMQDVLLNIIFKDSTFNNQHFVSTHSPKLINTATISHVLRFFKKGSVTQHLNFRTETKIGDDYDIVRLINSQNNEKVFFADRVALVEGICDRVLIEGLIKALNVGEEIVEVIDVGGKLNFQLYRNYLNQVQVPNFILADFDYLYDIGKKELSSLYVQDKAKLAKKIFNKTSVDGQTLLRLIEEHVENDRKDELKSLLGYIKARQVKLKSPLMASEKELMYRVRSRFAKQRLHVLSRGVTVNRKKYSGEIEDYLNHLGAKKHTSELMHKLASYVEKDDFLSDFIKNNDKRLIKELMIFLSDVLYDDTSRWRELVDKGRG